MYINAHTHTHLPLPSPHLPHTQCIKLLYSENKRGRTLLYYIAGGRVLRYTQRTFANERTLTKLLRFDWFA